MLARLPVSARGVRRPFGRRVSGCVRSTTPSLLYCPHAPGGSRSRHTVCLRGPLIPLQRRPRTDRERQCSGVAAEPTDGGKALLLLLLLSARARVSCAGGVCPSRVWEGRRAEACWGGVCMGRVVVLGVTLHCVTSTRRAGILNHKHSKPHPTRAGAAGWSYGGRQAAVYGAGLLQVGGIRRHAKLHRAWRGTAVSRGGLCQVSCRRYGLLCGAWWRTTVSRGGLYHGSSRRNGLLRGAWRGPTV